MAPSVPCTISREDYQQYWKKAKESTSSSFSGLHFGHWKSAASYNFLSEIHSLFTEITISTGYIPLRWTFGLTVMLEKSPGNILVDKLWAILLMEADFNFANKLIIGSRMMWNAEDSHQTVKEALGGQHNHDTREVAVNRRITANVARQLVQPMAIASVDATQCFDSITHTPGALACRRLGTPTTFLACTKLCSYTV